MKKLEILLRKFLLSMLLLFNPSSKKNDIPHLSPNSKVLFIRLNRIGDALVSTPLIKIVKKTFDCHVAVLADKKNHFVFANNPYIDEIIIFPKGIKGVLETKNKINSCNYDVLVDMHDDVSTTVSYLIALCRIKFKVGLKKGNDKLYTNLVERLDSSKYHVIDRALEIAKIFNISYDTETVNVVYHPMKESEDYCKKFIKKNIPKNKIILGINISAGSRARFWGVSNFQKFIDSIKDYNELSPLLISAPGDYELAKEISNGEIAVYCEKEFDKFAALVKHIDFLFTPDTSIIHLASSFEVPVFGLYVKYNTDDVIWYPYQSKYKAVITTEPNFQKLNFDNVLEKFQSFYENNKLSIN